MIHLQNISFFYGDKPVFKDFSLEIEQGLVTVLLGSSGCGKTTLLRLIAGLEVPETGVISVEEEIFTQNNNLIVPPSKRKTAFVFQDLALWPHMTVRQHIAFALKHKKNQDINRQTDEILSKYHLTDLAERYPYQLSGGQQQLLAIARAIATHPRIILLDEPLANLDVLKKNELLKSIKKLNKNEGITLIYVTHDHREAFKIADRIIVLNQGKIEVQGTHEEVLKSENEYINALINY